MEDKKNELTEEYLKSILPSRPVFRIEFSDEKCGYTDSKLGGSFYWPEGRPASEIELCCFLAQINFEELPENDIFPKHGLLQFFTDGSDEGFVIYHKDVSENGIELETDDASDDSPVMKEAKILFKPGTEYMSWSDYRFSEYEDEDEVLDSKDLCALFDGSGSKLLGYPYFTQFDPRDNSTDSDSLLLQIDSDGEYVMWGDFGVGNFFMNDNDLRDMDFSGVFFTWDCC